ncbi:Glycosyl transferases group 1 [Lachnospiraceae bacterium XBB1006]|nr:Glycosyl transferases group 1 [Lachnospiraceae bacterium XBB1006]
MKKGLLLFSGAVETLEFFSAQLAMLYKKDGYDIFTYRIDKEKEDFEALRSFLSFHETLLVTFNYIGMSGEEFLQEGRDNVFSLFPVRKKVILVDHPIYYHDQLTITKEETEVYCVDEDHVDYIKTYYSQIKNVRFLPLAGTELATKHKTIKERTIPLLFAGNYVRKERLLSYLTGLNQDYKDFYYSIVEDLKKNPEQSIQFVMENSLLSLFPNASKKELAAAMHGMLFVDLYIRSYFRAKVVKTIADAKIPIYVIGKDWQYLNVEHPEYIHMLGNGYENTEFCLRHMEETKLSLNVMPWFKRGFHDRIPSSMLQKAVSITDSSDYISNNFIDKEDLLLYSLKEIEKIPDLIHRVLKDEEYLQNMAEQSYKKAKKKHTWQQRYEKIQNTTS